MIKVSGSGLYEMWSGSTKRSSKLSFSVSKLLVLNWNWSISGSDESLNSMYISMPWTQFVPFTWAPCILSKSYYLSSDDVWFYCKRRFLLDARSYYSNSSRRNSSKIKSRVPAELILVHTGFLILSLYSSIWGAVQFSESAVCLAFVKLEVSTCSSKITLFESLSFS